MCRHCSRLVEDVEMAPAVHLFMEETAKRLSKKHGFEVTADEITVSFEFPDKLHVPGPRLGTEAAARIIGILREMDR